MRGQEEIVRTPASGKLQYRQVNAVPVKDEHDRLLGSVSIVRDITENKKAETALKESEEKFAKAFHANPAGHLITRRSDGVILDVNGSYERLLGYSRAELVGHKTTELNINLYLQEPSAPWRL